MPNPENNLQEEILDPKVQLWRGITGAYDRELGHFFGVRNPNSEGILTSNYSRDQYFGSRMSMDEAWYIGGVAVNIVNRRVGGLPVFFDRKQALSWLTEKKFQNSPVLATVELPLSLVSGNNAKLRITKNAGLEIHDVILDENALKEIIAGEIPSGEAFLASTEEGLIDPQNLRPFETLYVFSLKEDGTIDEESLHK